MADRTFHVPGTRPVAVRELGPRELLEVPRSEGLIADLGLADRPVGEEVSRAVLDTYGLSRLGSKVAAYLEQCQRYRFDR